MSGLTITSWNLQGSRDVDPGAVAAHVREAGTDVLLLQEVQCHQARDLARRLQARSRHWSFKHWPVRTWPEGMAVLGLTRPFAAVRSRALTAPWRLLDWRRRIVQVGTLPWEGHRITVVNVHLSPHEEGADSRKRELREVLDGLTRSGRLNGQGTVCVVAGDFNAEPDTDLLGSMRDEGFTTSSAGPTGWHGDPSDRPPERELDQVWVAGRLQVREVGAPRHGDPGFGAFPGISDHLPVTLTCTISALP